MPPSPLMGEGWGGGVMIVVINKLTAKDVETARHIEARFRDRMKAVDGRPGFLSFELWKDAENPLVLSSVTRWETREAFDTWTASDDFKKAHDRHAAATREARKPGEAPRMTSEVTIHEIVQGS